MTLSLLRQRPTQTCHLGWKGRWQKALRRWRERGSGGDFIPHNRFLFAILSYGAFSNWICPLLLPAKQDRLNPLRQICSFSTKSLILASFFFFFCSCFVQTLFFIYFLLTLTKNVWLHSKSKFIFQPLISANFYDYVLQVMKFIFWESFNCTAIKTGCLIRRFLWPCYGQDCWLDSCLADRHWHPPQAGKATKGHS